MKLVVSQMSIFDPTMIIWLDETGCDKRNAARQYGYSLRVLLREAIHSNQEENDTHKSWQ